MNRILLEQLKAKHKLWGECFSGKDRNSILNQINQMVWNAAVFKVINEARKYSSQNQSGEFKVNTMVHDFINRCFFDSQFSAIRRLTDCVYKLEDPKKGITSLCALIKNMKENTSLMSRKNMFYVDGLEYDYEKIRQREEEYHQGKTEKGISTYYVPEELNSNDAKNRHDELDILCGVSRDQRGPCDCIQAKVFVFLIKKLENVTEEINHYVKKYVAHAATPGSRVHDNAEEVNITFEYFWNAHKVICQVANFIDLYMLNRTHHVGFLPVPQYNHFESIDNPLVTRDRIEMLKKVWREFQKESDSWGSWFMDDFKKEIEKQNA